MPWLCLLGSVSAVSAFSACLCHCVYQCLFLSLPTFLPMPLSSSLSLSPSLSFSLALYLSPGTGPPSNQKHTKGLTILAIRHVGERETRECVWREREKRERRERLYYNIPVLPVLHARPPPHPDLCFICPHLQRVSPSVRTKSVNRSRTIRDALRGRTTKALLLIRKRFHHQQPPPP